MSTTCELTDDSVLDILKKIVWHKSSKINIRSLISTLPSEEPFEEISWHKTEWDKSLDKHEEEIFNVLSPYLKEIQVETFRQQCE